MTYLNVFFPVEKKSSCLKIAWM